MQEAFIDVDDLSRFLKIKRQTAYHFVATLDIPHYRVGKLIRFKLSEVEEWMNKNKSELKVPYGKVEGI